ncbi:FtsX-like permease family protein [Companilactobacillus insicii]|uniref:FtsX-like permease family protein n=1 Tax=Companilactobacillus insicii TaxID=1732567 RepID=UPI000F77321E|nr:FtsX-like permease family protein [Companilactobacillus insicii]
MYLKIIRRSLAKMHDSYLIYILSCSFAIGIFSILISLTNNKIMKHDVSMWRTSLMPIVFSLSLVFAVSAFIYMAYVGGFFIKQQRHEFLTFQKLGMSKITITIIGFLQTLVIQFLAWVLGIIEALIFQKFFGMLLLYLMHVRINFTAYLRVNSLITLLQIAGYAIVAFSLINAVRTYRIVRNNKPKQRKVNFWLRIPAGTLGIVLFVSALAVNISMFASFEDYGFNGYTDRIVIQIIYILFGFFFGTYLIYFGFLPVLLTILQKIKRLSYSGLNMFSFKYLKGRLKRNTSVLWFVTELSAMALMLLTVCYFGYQLIYDNYHSEYPFALTANSDTVDDVRDTIKNSKTKVKKEYHSKIKTTLVSTLDPSGHIYVQRPASFMSYSEYMRLPDKIRASNPYINPKQFMRIGFGNDETFGFSDHKVEWNVKGAKKITTRKNGSSFPYGGGMFAGSLMIVPDKYYKNLPTKVTDTFYGWYFKHGDKLSKEQVKQLDKHRYAYIVNVEAKSSLEDSTLTIKKYNQARMGENDYIQSGFVRQESAKRHLNQIVGFFIFMITIFSIALLIALGSVLTLRILLRDDHEWRQLRTLKKIGVSNREIRSIVLSENALTFVIPIVFAIMQAYALILLADNGARPLRNEFIMIVVSYVILYGIIGIITYLISWRSVKRRIN